MKLAIAAIVIASASAFAPATPTFGVARSVAFAPAVAPLAGGGEDDEAGLDLNLEEMFDMFDAADNEEEFDDAIKKVKSDE
mmetsp:Transcript_15280/g.22398  ORF Transcript_15280/g.22398 Transcript_15280/m.22398 type:complete len:81 (-) Transcript_15280:197-439(-)|eukprot:CAMPEP_0197247682 /NCGR_PEP_ID=MMETSP1429-20130617/30918_1 /TAXON_ID=49237 /ORGANISM="Chaetoceros  sp., Strain UNC1202" /LENGTH=80 /DNA_ID=CAMNT_0042708647 /DNA_START=31 /DNA_END=273 /DNA_ORIENTATION=-